MNGIHHSPSQSNRRFFEPDPVQPADQTVESDPGKVAEF